VAATFGEQGSGLRRRSRLQATADGDRGDGNAQKIQKYSSLYTALRPKKNYTMNTYQLEPGGAINLSLYKL
jgi:hypothetical protein